MIHWIYGGVFLKITIDEDVLKRLLPIVMLGLVEAMEVEAIESEEGEVICFNPYTEHYFEKIKSDDNLIEAIRLGMELDDVCRLVPHAYQMSLQELKQKTVDIIKRGKRFEYPILRIFDD